MPAFSLTSQLRHLENVAKIRIFEKVHWHCIKCSYVINPHHNCCEVGIIREITCRTKEGIVCSIRLEIAPGIRYRIHKMRNNVHMVQKLLSNNITITSLLTSKI